MTETRKPISGHPHDFLLEYCRFQDVGVSLVRAHYVYVCEIVTSCELSEKSSIIHQHYGGDDLNRQGDGHKRLCIVHGLCRPHDEVNEDNDAQHTGHESRDSLPDIITIFRYLAQKCIGACRVGMLMMKLLPNP